MEEMALERGTVELGQVSLTYGRAGAGVPLVLIHGLGGSTRWWTKNVGSLAEQFEVFAVDLAGFGESCDGQQFALDDAAGQLAAWMKQLGIGPAILVGHSMGGHIALELAAGFPELVERLVLVDPAALPLRRGLGQHLLGFARALWRTPMPFLPVFATDIYRAGPLTLWSGARALLAADIRPKLARVRTPTLVIWGERDTVVPPETGWRLVRRLPNADLAIIRDAGHSPMWDRPETFNRLVVDFLAVKAKPVEEPSRAEAKSQGPKAHGRKPVSQRHPHHANRQPDPAPAPPHQ